MPGGGENDWGRRKRRRGRIRNIEEEKPEGREIGGWVRKK